MSNYYNVALNTSKTIDLPSNLLRQRSIPRSHLQVNNTIQPTPLHSTTPRTTSLTPAIQDVTLVEEKKKSKKSVLYKRLNHIKQENQQLQRYSYSKLLSKMVIVDPANNSQTIDHDKFRTRSQYSCLRGRLFSIDYEDNQKKEDKEEKEKTKPSKDKDRSASGIGQYLPKNMDYAGRTTRIFKRFYMPSGQKITPAFFNQSSPDQKYIYINGKKTQCKRIHNFYTSVNFKTSYDKAFGKGKQLQPFSKTRDHFFTKKTRY